MTTKELDEKLGLLLVELDKIQKFLAEIHVAIRTTVADGTYDETLIRKAVSFELAEIIVSYREQMSIRPPSGVDADSRSVARVIHGDEETADDRSNPDGTRLVRLQGHHDRS